MNLHRFKLNLAYSISFTSSNVGKCFWSWILKECIKVQEKERKREPKLLSCVPVLDRTWIQAFSCCSRATTAKKCTKKSVIHVQSCCFANQTYCFFCRSRCRPRRRCLSKNITYFGNVYHYWYSVPAASSRGLTSRMPFIQYFIVLLISWLYQTAFAALTLRWVIEFVTS